MKTLLNLFIPTKISNHEVDIRRVKHCVAAIIPTYKPSDSTFKLISYLYVWNPSIKIIVVDDCTPVGDENSTGIFAKIAKLALVTKSIHIIHTPKNQLKAGAINFGLYYLKNLKLNPDTVLTFDDDVMIEKKTIPKLIRALYQHKRIGAVCTLTKVSNKNTNLLTRLQGLEYHSFNITKIADNGFVRGPLVMPGMLVAFRYEAINQVNGFTTGHLIEDYDITAKLKRAGWEVAVEPSAVAWTNVQTEVGKLWKQRVRWTYGGLHVLADFWSVIPAIVQDLIGHILFILMTIFIGLSLLIPFDGIDQGIAVALILVAGLQFAISLAFNFWSLIIYEQVDGWDYVIRLSLVPELIYSYILSFLLLGSYLFFLYNLIWKKILQIFPGSNRIYHLGFELFSKFGYSTGWGTR